ncbi:MAG: hypothetical protein COW08_01565 [Ignavibacteriales bacterium CG12_big_fil_rev_8_21_14_0_65_30_8]|nr:MAG: hypothetical protein COW08_01565 [Ignavibacteriales bacterium CG12_big_fil_rev_8_21_14_0_65_30_8]
MTSKPEPWYIHAALYVVIVILIGVLIKVAIIDPKNVVESEKFFKNESRLRMENIKQAEILWEQKHKSYTDNLDSLVNFIKYDTKVQELINSFDTVIQRSLNPFTALSDGEFVPESLYKTPKSLADYILEIDTSTNIDTVTNRYGRIKRIDTTIVLGKRYFLKDPDGYGTVGSLFDDALKNTASWE